LLHHAVVGFGSKWLFNDALTTEKKAVVLATADAEGDLPAAARTSRNLSGL